MQKRVEADLAGLLGRVIDADHPFLGACYGIGTLGTHQGAVVDRTYSEPVGPAQVTLTREGQRDALLSGLPATFDAFVGHKEAISELPSHAVVLATSPACPVQAFRIGSHVYATQFHPELDVTGLCTRIDVYKHAGYFEPHQAGELKEQARRSAVRHPPGDLAPLRHALCPHSGRLAHGVEVPLPADALERVRAAVLEFDARAGDEIPDGAGDQDIAWLGDSEHP